MTMNNNLISSLKSSILKLETNRQMVIDLCEAALLAMHNGRHYVGLGERTLTVDEALQMLKSLRCEI